MNRRVFISYGRDAHASIAERLHADLAGLGLEIWRDESDIRAGDDWERRIEDGIDWVAADPSGGCLLLIMTPHSVRPGTSFCRNELERARRRGIRIIPIMAVICLPPLSINPLQFIDMSDCFPPENAVEVYQRKLGLLLQAIQEGRLVYSEGDSRLYRLLQPPSFEIEWQEHSSLFVGRQWLLDDVGKWMETDRAVPLRILVAPPGFGKTAFCVRLQAVRDDVVAIHFCRAGQTDRINHRSLVKSLAYQLCSQLSEYKEALLVLDLELLLQNESASSLFQRLLTVPLAKVTNAKRRLVILDGMDEGTIAGHNELARFLASQLPGLPHWIRVLIATRPDQEVETVFQVGDRIVLTPEAPENMVDLRLFVSTHFRTVADEDVIPQIVAKSEGLFLYPEILRREKAIGRFDPRASVLPKGLGGIFHRFFRQQFPHPQLFGDTVRPALELILAAAEPIPTDLIEYILALDVYKKRELFASIGSLFPIRSSRVAPFHRSVLDWVASEDSGSYYVDAAAGHRKLASALWTAAYQHKSNDWRGYSTLHLPLHLMKAHEWDRLTQVLSDIQFITTKRFDPSQISEMWAAVEVHSQHRMINAYHHLIDNPDKCVNVSTLIGSVLRNGGFTREALKLAEARLRDTTRQEHVHTRLMDLEDVAILRNDCGDLDGASGVLEQLHNESASHGDLFLYANTLGNLSVVFMKAGLPEKAMEVLSEEQAIYCNLGVPWLGTRCLLNQAATKSLMGRADEALELTHEAERIAGTNDQVTRQRAIRKRAQILRGKGGFAEALKLLETAETLARQMGTVLDLVDIVAEKAAVLLQLGKVDQARSYYEEAESLALQMASKSDHLVRALCGRAQVAQMQGDNRESIRLLDDAERILDSIGERHVLLNVGITRAQIYIDCCEWGKAEQLYEALERRARATKQLEELAAIRLGRGEALHRLGQRRAAALAFDESIVIASSAGYKAMLAHAIAQRLQLHSEGGEGEIEDIGLLVRQLEQCPSAWELRTSVGCLLFERKEYERAWVVLRTILVEADGLPRELCDAGCEVACQAVLAHSRNMRAIGNLAAAETFLDDAIVLADANQQIAPRVKCLLLGDLSRILGETGQFTKCLEVSRRWRSLTEDPFDRRTACANEIGSLLELGTPVTELEGPITQLETESEAAGDSISNARAINLRAAVALKQGNHQEAEALLKGQEYLARSTNSKDLLLSALVARARQLVKRQADPAEVAKLLYESNQLSMETDEVLPKAQLFALLKQLGIDDLFDANASEAIRKPTTIKETRKGSRPLGRNERCWCGSGKKYKKCHLELDSHGTIE